LLQCECTGLVTLFMEKPEPDFDSTPYYRVIGIQPAPGREQRPGGVLQRCSCLSHSRHVHDGIGARGVRGAVVANNGGAIAFPGVADELVVAHLVAVAALDLLVRVGFPGARQGLVGGSIGGGPVAIGLARASKFIQLGFDGGNTAFVVGFDIFKSGEEVGFRFFVGRRDVVLVDRQYRQCRDTSEGH
jgi:hypothetical protein